MDSIDNFVPDFSNILLGKKPLGNGLYTCVLSETNINISANPMISSLLPFFLKNNISVFLVAAQESLIHYASICKKMGFNIVNNENFYFYDAFYSPYKQIIKEELPLSENVPYTFGTSRSKNYIDGDLVNKSTFDFHEIIELLGKTKFKNERTVLIFDNISILPFNKQTINDDINKILKTCTDQVKYLLKKNINVVINKNSELVTQELNNFLSNLADIEISFSPNLAGYSKDIDGQVFKRLKLDKLYN